MRKEIGEKKKEVVGILRRLRERDFTGDTGKAIKNSIFNLSTNFVAKVGSILFTIIMARMLLPELFGLYSLALSTIVLLSFFSDLGISTALIQFISKELGKKNGNPSKYYNYLFNLKIKLSFLATIGLLLIAYPISHWYYNKPIFLALIAGAFYIFANNLLTFFTSLHQAYNDFSKTLTKEIIFQVARLIFIPLAIIMFLRYSTEFFLFSVFISLSLSYAISLAYLYIKKPKYNKDKLEEFERKETISFILPLTVTGLSGMFFGYIDMFMLGRFVQPEFIGYYQAALALIGSAGALIGFSGALFPLFSRLSGVKLKSLFRQSVFYTLLLAAAGVVATYFLSGIVINIIYGKEYILSILILKIFAIMLVFDSPIGIYSSFLISQSRPLIVAKILIVSTIINVGLTYFFISSLAVDGQYAATIGASIAVIIAKAIHLSFLFIAKHLFDKSSAKISL
jgi:O-antigen/teichoic acid export membrane protein